MLLLTWSSSCTSQQTHFTSVWSLFQSWSRFFSGSHSSKVAIWLLSKILLGWNGRLLMNPAAKRSQKHSISNENTSIRLACSDWKWPSWCSDACHDTDFGTQIRSLSLYKHVVNPKSATLTTVRDFSSNTNTFWGLTSPWMIPAILLAVVKY